MYKGIRASCIELGLAFAAYAKLLCTELTEESMKIAESEESELFLSGLFQDEE